MTLTIALSDDQAVVTALRAGDDDVFTALINRYHASFVHVARSIVQDRMAAEDVAQETWLAVLRGIDRFEMRCSLRTWLYRVLVNTARARARNDRRVVALSSGWQSSSDDQQTADLTDRPDLTGPARWWSVAARPDEDPEMWTGMRETQRVIRAAMMQLPHRQRVVVELRDVQGLSAEE